MDNYREKLIFTAMGAEERQIGETTTVRRRLTGSRRSEVRDSDLKTTFPKRRGEREGNLLESAGAKDRGTAVCPGNIYSEEDRKIATGV